MVLFPAVALAASPAVTGEVALAAFDRSPNSPMRRAIDQASCTGEYADEILALSNEAREFERRPEASYSYCLRNTAQYECLSYGRDGKVRKSAITVEAHGSAFAYKVKSGDYYLLTNEHVANWPLVTDEDHVVDDVPPGCKKIDEQLHLVRDESDDYEPGWIPVQRVVTDPYLDAAVLKTRHQLNVMPYRVGRSALLRAGNIVQARGYPLGIMQATNSGKVVTPYDLDREKGWNHVDFVTDALLTKGNSGSPVFAISCRTGALELVGIYHAGYRGSPALNVVVGIDQLHDLMENFRRSKPPVSDSREPLGPDAHARIVAALQRVDALPFFAVGDRVARARLWPDGRVTYEIFSDAFPASDAVDFTLEETAAPDGGTLTMLSVTGTTGPPRRSETARLDAEAQDVARNLFELTRRQFLLTMNYRLATIDSGRTREAFRHVQDLAQQIDGTRGQGTELLHSMKEVASRIPSPTLNSQALSASIADVAAQLAPPRQERSPGGPPENGPAPAGQR